MMRDNKYVLPSKQFMQFAAFVTREWRSMRQPHDVIERRLWAAASFDAMPYTGGEYLLDDGGLPFEIAVDYDTVIKATIKAMYPAESKSKLNPLCQVYDEFATGENKATCSHYGCPNKATHDFSIDRASTTLLCDRHWEAAKREREMRQP